MLGDRMFKSKTHLRATALMGATALGAGLLLPSAGPAAAQVEPGLPWAVSLGDSYISGEGAVYTNKHTAAADPENSDPVEWTWARDTIGSLPDIYFDNADGSSEQIPFCHRSPFSPGVIEGYQTLNLACSGAEAESKISGTGDKALPKPGVDFNDLEWRGMTIPGQAKMLETFATTNDVELIFLSIGGNDFQFADLATGLLTSGNVIFGSQPITFGAPAMNPDPDLAAQIQAYQKWSGEELVNFTADRVKSAVINVTTAMANAGKAPGDYKIVYQSTPRPVPNGPDYNPQESTDLFSVLDTKGDKTRIGGCPIWGKEEGTRIWGAVGKDMTNFIGDAEWVYNTVFPNLIRAQKQGVAAAVGELGDGGPVVVYNDVSESFDGNELCGKDIVRQADWTATEYSWPNNPPVYGPGQGEDTEWVNAVGFATGYNSLSELSDSPLNLTQVLHPNYWGQRALAACNELAAASDATVVECMKDPAGGTDEQGRPLMKSVAPAAFTPMAPMRVLDTRAAGAGRAAGPVAAGTPVEVDLTGIVPAGTTAVSYNVTVTGQTASGFAEVAPAGAASGSSTINWGGPLQTIANGHITKLGTGNKIAVTVEGAGTAEIIIDITGAFTGGDGAGFTPTDRRVYDSRDGDGPLAAGQSRTMNINDDIRALNDGPAPVAAAVNVTITGTTGSGVLSVAKDQTADTSTINWSAANQTMANAVITDVADDGTFTVTNNGDTATDVIVDLTGTFTPGQGAMYYAVDPVRAYDSRTETPLTDTRPRTTALPVPEDAVAVAVNTTITGTTGSGWLAITPGTGAPQTSTVNWYDSPTTRANGSIAGVTQTSTTAHVGGFYSTHYLHDITGYFAGGVTPTPVVEALTN